MARGLEHACQSGVCTCNSGTHFCNATCVSNSSTSLCGTSCTACPVPSNGSATCDGTSCGVKCNSATFGTQYTACGGACINEQTDGNNCGGCGAACTGGATCQNGRCACANGQTTCGGTCVSTSLTTSCAGCNVCSTSTGTPSCNGRTCSPEAVAVISAYITYLAATGRSGDCGTARAPAGSRREGVKWVRLAEPKSAPAEEKAELLIRLDSWRERLLPVPAGRGALALRVDVEGVCDNCGGGHAEIRIEARPQVWS